MAIRVKGSSKVVSTAINEARKVMVGTQEFDLSNISKMSDMLDGQPVSTFTITNYVNRAGAGTDTRSVYEKAHDKAANRYTVTIPFKEGEQDEVVREVSERIEEVFRSELQKFQRDFRLTADRDQIIRSEAYKRAKRDITVKREMSEDERDRKIGHLMPKKRNVGRFDLSVRMSVKDPSLDKGEASTAWRDTEVGRVGTYNAYGVGTVPLVNKAQVEAAAKISEDIARVILPAVAGETDYTKIWNALKVAVTRLHVREGYDPNANAGFTPEEEGQIEEIKAQMISGLLS